MIEFAKLHLKAQQEAILKASENCGLLTEFAAEFLQEEANKAIDKTSDIEDIIESNIKKNI